MCDQQSLRSACAYVQSDQSLCLSVDHSMIVELLIEHHLEFLILIGGCTDSSESTLVKMSHCWKPHVTAKLSKRIQRSLPQYDDCTTRGTQHTMGATTMCVPRGGGETPLPWKITKIKGFLAILVWIPWKSQSYQSSIQCWAITSTQTKRHLNLHGVSLAGRWWPAYNGIRILTPLIIPWQNFLDPRMNNKQWTTINKISILCMININWLARKDTIYHLWETIKWSN